MRGLYFILSAVGWAWCLAAGVFLWLRTRRPRGDGGGAAGTVVPVPAAKGPAAEAPAAEGREDVSV